MNPSDRFGRQEIGLRRDAITLLDQETATRVDLEAVNRLCPLFCCEVGKLFESVQ